MYRFIIISALFLFPLILSAQLIIPAVSDPVFEQLPIIYVHGFNDDGRGWAMDLETGAFTGTPAHYWQQLGIYTFVTQWWAPGGNPYANADLGWARFFTPAEVRGEVAGVTPYNSPDPSEFIAENYQQLFNPITAGSFMINLYNNRVVSNYNRNGMVEAHAQNLVDAFRSTEGFGGKFGGFRQVNLITHSAGGLDTRAMLSILNESDDQRERERVANVIYTAPPFAGSNMAKIAQIIWQPDEIDGSIFEEPWMQAGVGEKTVEEFITYLLLQNPSWTTTFAKTLLDVFLDIADAVIRGFGTLSGINVPELSAITVGDLVSDQLLANVIAAAIQDLRIIFGYASGFPGDPKVWEDLTPEKAVEHLTRWSKNPHTRQFVTWGEGGPRINATPSLTDGQSNFSLFTNPQGLQRRPDDLAVSNVSARVLTTENGGMTALQGYSSLDHGTILLGEIETVAPDWAKTLLTPVTKLFVSEPVKYADEGNRYFIVGPDATFQFDPEDRNFTDRFANSIVARAKEVEYRVAARNNDGTMEFHDWVTVPNNFSAQFATLIDPYDLSGERLFRFDWRAVNEADAREPIRSAFFAIDDLPPSLTNIDVIHVGVEDSPEVYGSQHRSMEGFRVVSQRLVPRFQNVSWFDELHNQPLTDWVIRDQSNKILFLQFDQSATVEFQWGDPLFTNSEIRNTVNQNLSFVLSDLPDGPNTLYFEAEDAAGNTSLRQMITVLVDNQPPAAVLDYEPPAYLSWVVGPETPLSVLVEDLETQVVDGSVSVPGFTQSLPLGSTFILGDTDIAEQGQAIGAYGMFVPIRVIASDAVGNSIDETFEVYYDWTPPELDLQYVGRSTVNQGHVYLQSDGTYITTENRVHVEITVTTNAAGTGPVYWQSSNIDNEIVRSGGPMLPNQFIRGFAHGGFVNLFDGVNIIVFSTTDDYGQDAFFTLTIEKVDQLFDDIERPIELIAEGGVDQIAASDDGSVLVFRRSNQIYAWRGGEIVQVDVNEAGEPANDRSRNPAVSGNGRYVYFASRATNLIDEEVSGKNFYVKDLHNGNVGLLSRNKDGEPVNMSVVFARFAFTQNAATYSGRYIFFHDRYSDYIEDATDNGFDIYAVDLDPNLSGDFFDSPYEIRRVSLGPGGVEGTGGGTPTVPGGSRYPSVSTNGLYLTFETTHTNLFPNDDNDNADAVLARFNDVDENGTIDFSDVTNIPLNVNEDGTLNTWGGRAPWVDRSGRVVVFRTSGNLLASDTNREGVDEDVYSSTGFIENWQNRVLRVESKSVTNESVEGRIWGTPTVSLYDAEVGARVAFVSDMDQLVPGDNNDSRDLFVRSESGIEAINWITPDVPAGPDLGIAGGITADGTWAFWNTVNRYAGLNYTTSGRALHRRHIDTEPPAQAPEIVQHPGNRDVYIGQSASFSVQATGFPTPGYQWYFNGEPVEGAVQSVLTVQNVGLEDRGQYFVTVTNDLGTATSEPALLSVTSLVPLISEHPQGQSVEEGSDVSFQVEAIGVAPLQYRWQKDGNDISESNHISGVHEPELAIESVTFDDAGEYRVIVSNGAGADTSDTVILAVTPLTSVRYQSGIPEVFALHQNYPNPFNPSTQIRFDIPHEANIRLEIYNVLGQRVAVLVDEYRFAGYYTEHFDAGHLASGMYFFRIQAGDFTQVRKFMLVR